MAIEITNISNINLAKYLTVAANQRKRSLTKFISDYGPTSAIVAECQAELAEIDITINNLTKAAAAEPLRKVNK